MKKKEQLRTSSVISLHLAESKVRPTESGVVDAPPATASRDDHHADAPEHTLHLPHGHLKRYADRTEAGSFRRIPYRCARTTLYVLYGYKFDRMQSASSNHPAPASRQWNESPNLLGKF